MTNTLHNLFLYLITFCCVLRINTACSTLPTLTYGTITYSQSSPYPSGTVATFTCDQTPSAYQLLGQATSQCDGTSWSGTMPTCALDVYVRKGCNKCHTGCAHIKRLEYRSWISYNGLFPDYCNPTVYEGIIADMDGDGYCDLVCHEYATAGGNPSYWLLFGRSDYTIEIRGGINSNYGFFCHQPDVLDLRDMDGDGLYEPTCHTTSSTQGLLSDVQYGQNGMIDMQTAGNTLTVTVIPESFFDCDDAPDALCAACSPTSVCDRRCEFLMFDSRFNLGSFCHDGFGRRSFADFNGDGLCDIGCATAGVHQYSYGKSDLSFEPPVQVFSGWCVFQHVVIADIDGDNEGEVVCMPNTSVIGQESVAHMTINPQGPTNYLTVDLSLLQCHYARGACINVKKTNRRGKCFNGCEHIKRAFAFHQYSYHAIFCDPTVALAVSGDLNNDGICDSVCHGFGVPDVGKVYIVYGQADYTVVEATNKIAATGEQAGLYCPGEDMILRDIDNDGRDDPVCVPTGSSDPVTITYYGLNAGMGGFNAVTNQFQVKRNVFDCSTTQTNDAFGCPSGWIGSKPFCYRHVGEGFSRDAAKDECKKIGGRLPLFRQAKHITDLDKIRDVVATDPSKRYVLLDAIKTGGVWAWESDNTNTFFQFHPSHGSNVADQSAYAFLDQGTDDMMNDVVTSTDITTVQTICQAEMNVVCPIIAPSTNMDIVYTMLPFVAGTTAELSCASGQTTSGGLNKLFCGPTGQWSDPLPTCIALTCSQSSVCDRRCEFMITDARFNLGSYCQGTSERRLLGDFNGDGLCDIGCHSATTGDVTFSIGKSDFSLNSPVQVLTGWCTDATKQVVFADVDNDNLGDLVCIPSPPATGLESVPYRTIDPVAGADLTAPSFDLSRLQCQYELANCKNLKKTGRRGKCFNGCEHLVRVTDFHAFGGQDWCTGGTTTDLHGDLNNDGICDPVCRGLVGDVRDGYIWILYGQPNFNLIPPATSNAYGKLPNTAYCPGEALVFRDIDADGKDDPICVPGGASDPVTITYFGHVSPSNGFDTVARPLTVARSAFDCSTAQPNHPIGCPDNWIGANPFCYRYLGVGYQRYDAMKECDKLGGRLPMFRSSKDLVDLDGIRDAIVSDTTKHFVWLDAVKRNYIWLWESDHANTFFQWKPIAGQNVAAENAFSFLDDTAGDQMNDAGLDNDHIGIQTFCQAEINMVCPVLTPTTGLEIVYSMLPFEVGTKAVLSCPAGKVVSSGLNELVCGPIGQWNQPLPTCVEPCPSGWLIRSPYCYKDLGQAQTYSSAKIACSAANARLPLLKNDQELAEFESARNELAANPMRAWLGIYRPANGAFTWNADPTNAWTKWDPTWGLNSGAAAASCVMVEDPYQLRWIYEYMNDVVCSYVISTICQLDVATADCSALTANSGTTVAYSSSAPYSSGTVATFSCSIASQGIVGSAALTCISGGTWDSVPPSCQAMTCPPSPVCDRKCDFLTSDARFSLGSFCPSTAQRRLGDFNGDGLCDMACISSGSIEYSLGKKDFTFETTAQVLTGWCADTVTKKVVLADVTGDDESEMVCVANNPVTGLNALDYRSINPVATSDVNIASFDLSQLQCNFESNSGSCINVRKMNRRGKCFNGCDHITNANVFNLTWCTPTLGNSIPGDFNGDGVCDLLCHGFDSSIPGWTWMFYGYTDYSVIYPTGGGFQPDYYCIGETLLIRDVDGDNKDDIVCVPIGSSDPATVKYYGHNVGVNAGLNPTETEVKVELAAFDCSGTQPNDAVGCPNNWIGAKPYCYRHIGVGFQRYDAMKECEKVGGRLPMFRNSKEVSDLDVVRDKLITDTSEHNLWLDAVRRSASVWYWESDPLNTFFEWEPTYGTDAGSLEAFSLLDDVAGDKMNDVPVSVDPVNIQTFCQAEMNTVCPVLTPTTGLTIVYSMLPFEVGTKATLSCPVGKTVSSGLNELVCGPSGQWNEPLPTCVTDPSCISGWLLRSSYCYKDMSQVISNGEAKAACSAINARLPLLRNEQELLEFESARDELGTDTLRVWVGIERPANGEFSWPDDSANTWSKWDPARGQNADMSNPACAIIEHPYSHVWMYGSFNDADCNGAYSTICQMESGLDCPNITVNAGSIPTYSNSAPYAPGTVITFACSISDHEIVGSSTLICNTDKTWDNPPPTCEAVGCETSLCARECFHLLSQVTPAGFCDNANSVLHAGHVNDDSVCDIVCFEDENMKMVFGKVDGSVDFSQVTTSVYAGCNSAANKKLVLCDMDRDYFSDAVCIPTDSTSGASSVQYKSYSIPLQSIVVDLKNLQCGTFLANCPIYTKSTNLCSECYHACDHLSTTLPSAFGLSSSWCQSAAQITLYADVDGDSICDIICHSSTSALWMFFLTLDATTRQSPRSAPGGRLPGTFCSIPSEEIQFRDVNEDDKVDFLCVTAAVSDPRPVRVYYAQDDGFSETAESITLPNGKFDCSASAPASQVTAAKCNEKFCPPVPELPNTKQMTYNNAEPYPAGTLFDVVCDEGYEPTTNETLICGTTGSWIGTMPICRIPPPPPPVQVGQAFCRILNRCGNQAEMIRDIAFYNNGGSTREHIRFLAKTTEYFNNINGLSTPEEQVAYFYDTIFARIPDNVQSHLSSFNSLSITSLETLVDQAIDSYQYAIHAGNNSVAGSGRAGCSCSSNSCPKTTNGWFQQGKCFYFHLPGTVNYDEAEVLCGQLRNEAYLPWFHDIVEWNAMQAARVSFGVPNDEKVWFDGSYSAIATNNIIGWASGNLDFTFWKAANVPTLGKRIVSKSDPSGVDQWEVDDEILDAGVVCQSCPPDCIPEPPKTQCELYDPHQGIEFFTDLYPRQSNGEIIHFDDNSTVETIVIGTHDFTSPIVLNPDQRISMSLNENQNIDLLINSTTLATSRYILCEANRTDDNCMNGWQQINVEIDRCFKFYEFHHGSIEWDRAGCPEGTWRFQPTTELLTTRSLTSLYSIAVGSYCPPNFLNWGDGFCYKLIEDEITSNEPNAAVNLTRSHQKCLELGANLPIIENQIHLESFSKLTDALHSRHSQSAENSFWLGAKMTFYDSSVPMAKWIWLDNSLLGYIGDTLYWRDGSTVSLTDAKIDNDINTGHPAFLHLTYQVGQVAGQWKLMDYDNLGNSGSAVSTICAKKIDSCTNIDQITTTTTTPLPPPTTAAYPLSALEAAIVTVMQTIGCVFILIVLGATIGLFIIFREFSVERCLHMGQEISLLLAHILILFLREATWDKNTCLATGIGLQFLFTAVYSFMLVESFHTYTIMSNVISIGSCFPRYALILMALAIPSLTTICTAAMYHSSYQSQWSCWTNLENDVSNGTIIPILILVLVTVIFTEAAAMKNYVKLPLASELQRNAALINQKAMIFIVAANTGSWFVGLFAVFYVKIYLYTAVFVTNVLLGVAIFTFHTMGNPKANEFCRRMFKKICRRK